MTKTFLTTAAFALAIAVSAANPTIARADANAAFCATTYGMGGAITQCNFATYAQCAATVSGVGGSCSGNPAHSLARMPRSR